MELRNVWLFRFVVAGAVVIVAIVLLIMAMRADMTDKGGSRDKIAANETSTATHATFTVG